MEVGRLIAQQLGVEAAFVEGNWDGLFAGLDSSRYDIVINGVGVTEDRAEKYDFSTPYAYNRTVVIVRGDNEDIQSMEDLEGNALLEPKTPQSRFTMRLPRPVPPLSFVRHAVALSARD